MKKCCECVLLSHSVRPGLCQQSRAGRRHPWKRRVAGVQTQSVAQTADNVEEERQTDAAQQEVQQISPAASGDRRRSNDTVLCLEGKSLGVFCDDSWRLTAELWFGYLCKQRNCGCED